jgi:hypothetical protein
MRSSMLAVALLLLSAPEPGAGARRSTSYRSLRCRVDALEHHLTELSVSVAQLRSENGHFRRALEELRQPRVVPLH